MSAFVVENKHIENILYGVSVAGEKDNQKNKVQMVYKGEWRTYMDLAKELLEMNAEAVNVRYQSHDEPQVFEFSNNMQLMMTTGDSRVPTECGLIQAYKSLGCFLYQCSEGDVPDSIFFKEVEEFKAALADHIVTKMPEYDTAKW